ncbi:TonB-dependent receptor [Pontibacterium sp. N1Y112]|uniref:TonB-dependent receptor n=1 Tax=Pontibacterium sinense TaxID=2781979 RepID=A0A8J7FGV3_9GAMM|nr:TonB-dependent receptor [Pontibacterium sinense]MBE9397313.1 TonB-dependent receptor [Pontibacterium sinense]
MKNTLSLSAALLAALPAYAQDTQLDTVIVSATRFEASGNTTPTMVNVVSAEQIEASGANNIADVLRTQPGLHLRDASGTNNRVAISMRGFGQNSTNNVLVLVNGRRLNNQTLEAPNLNLIALNDIERIEIIQGSAGTLYGEQAVGGVINIITQPITDAQGRISISRGSDDQERYNLAYSRGFDNGFGLRLSAESQHADNYRDHSATDFNNVFGEIEKIHDSGRVFVELQKTEDDVELPNSLHINQKQANRRQSTSSDFLNYDSDVVVLGLEQDLAEQWELRGEYSIRDTDGKGILFSDYTQDTRVKSFTPRLLGKLGHADITLGYDRHRTDYVRGGYSPQTRQQTANAIYARAQMPLILDDLQLTIGGRESRVKDIDLRNNQDNSQSRFVKEIGLTYQLSAEQRVFLRRDESFRYANMDELAALPAGETFLKPQEGTSLEFGWEWSQSTTQLQATVFQLDLDNEIKYNATTFANENLDESRRRGLILSARHGLTPDLQLTGNYSYTDSEIKAGTHAGNEVPYVPNHSVALGLDYQLTNETNVYLDAKYTGAQFRDDDEANSLSQVGGYTVVNANVRWSFQQWDASLRINNLFDKEYDAYTIAAPWLPGGSAYYPAAGRQLMLTLGYSF